MCRNPFGDCMGSFVITPLSRNPAFRRTTGPSAKERKKNRNSRPLAGHAVHCILFFGVFLLNQSANGSSMEGAMSVGDQFFVVVDPSRKEKNEYISAEPLIKKVTGLCEVGLDINASR